jgi:hypothetical protein
VSVIKAYIERIIREVDNISFQNLPGEGVVIA